MNKLFVFVAFVGLLGCALAQSCGGNVIQPSGSIAMNQYDNNITCEWHLQAPNASYNFVALTVENYAMEYRFDYLSIYDANHDLLATLTGTSTNSFTIYTALPGAYIKFTSDISITDQGFQVNYQFSMDQPNNCAGPRVFSDEEGLVAISVTAQTSTNMTCPIYLLPVQEDDIESCGSFADIELEQWNDGSASAHADVYRGLSASGIPEFEFPSITENYVGLSMGVLINLQVANPIPGQVISVAFSFEKDSGCDSGSYSDSDSWSDSWSDSGSWWGYSSSSSEIVIETRILCIVVGVVGVLLLIILALVIKITCTKKHAAPSARLEEYERFLPPTTFVPIQASGYPQFVPMMPATPQHN